MFGLRPKFDLFYQVTQYRPTESMTQLDIR